MDRFTPFVLLCICSITIAQPTTPQVVVHRLPGGAVQPQVAVDSNQVVHLIYLAGDPAHSDIFYSRSIDHGSNWTEPIRVNSQPRSAIAIGAVRGPHIAIGRDSRVHVAWMGSSIARPTASNGASPMLYARLETDGGSFEPQRNLISTHWGLDGGASIASDSAGNVFVAWHAPIKRPGTEQERRVWVARSRDDGKTFAPEISISDPAAGACGCCGMRTIAFGGRLWVLYRGASAQINRGMHLIDCSIDLTDTHDREIAPMQIGMCVMSTAAFAPSGHDLMAAWETHEKIYWTRIDPENPPGIAHEVLDERHSCKHPAIAANPSGDIAVAWSVDTGWNKGGAVAWQVFDHSGRLIEGASGHQNDLPVWGSPAVFASSNDRFVIVY